MSRSPAQGKDQEVDQTIESLRSMDAHPLVHWSRELALLALLLAVLGAVLLDRSSASDVGSVRLYADVRMPVKEEHQWLRTALAGGLNGYLQNTSSISLVGGTGGSEQDLLEIPGAKREVGQVEADWLLQVTVRSHPKVEDQLAVELVLNSLSANENRFVEQLTGSVDNVHDLLSNILAVLHVRLGIDGTDVQDLQANGALMPSNTIAMKHYAQGLDALAAGRAKGAIQSILSAANDEPEHPAIEEALSRAYALAGYKPQAKARITVAFQQRERLAREQQLLVAGRYQMLHNQWQRAEELFRALHEFYPNQLRYGLNLAEAQARGSRYEAALNTLANLQTNDVFRDDARIPLIQAMVFQQQGSWPQGLAAAQRAYALAEQSGQPKIAADALFWQLQLGEPFDAKRFEKVRQIYERLEHPQGQSRTLRAFGKAAYREGDLLRSRSFYRRTAALAELHGLEGELATAHTNLAIISDLQGDLEAGLTLKHAVLANYQRRDIQGGIGITLENIGISLRKLGQLTQSDEFFGRAASNFEQVGDEIGLAWAPFQIALISLDRGAIDQTLVLLERAKIQAEQRPEGGLLGLALLAEGRALHLRGDFAAAEVAASAAHKHLDALDQRLHRGEAALLLSRISLARSNLAQSRNWLEQAEQQFDASSALANRALALQQRMRLGEDVCGALIELEDQLQELGPKLLSKLWLLDCRMADLNLETLQRDIAASELFEPKLKLARRYEPRVAERLAQENGWSLSAL